MIGIPKNEFTDDWRRHAGAMLVRRDIESKQMPLALRSLLLAARQSEDPKVREHAVNYMTLERFVEDLKGPIGDGPQTEST